MSKILFVVNDPAFFLSHRLPIALAAKAEGHEVHIATAEGKAVAEIKAHGFPFHALSLSRSGRNPLHELFSLLAIYRLFRELQPDLVHLVTIKPVLYGGMAARLAGVPSVVTAISGLGFVFIASGRKSKAMRALVALFYRLALGKRRLRVIFQNYDDRDALLNLGALDPGKVVMIRGSGADLSQCRYVSEPAGVPVVVMAARLLKDKGVCEFVDAAEKVRAQGLDVHFVLAGDVDPGNPASLTPEELDVIRQAGHVTLTGYCKDIAGLFAAAHIVVLPSYREGLPKVLVEAAACGRAVVTTDVPGCIDAIIPGETGIAVSARDSQSLADAIAQLVRQPDLRHAMGRAGRTLAEKEFDVKNVVRKHLDIYRELIEEAV